MEEWGCNSKGLFGLASLSSFRCQLKWLSLITYSRRTLPSALSSISLLEFICLFLHLLLCCLTPVPRHTH